IALGASVLLVVPVIGRLRSSQSAKWTTLLILGVTAAAVIICSHVVQDPGFTVSRGLNAMFALDPFPIFFKLLFIAAIGMVVLLSDDFLRESRYSAWEYYSLLAFALSGLLLLVSGLY